MAPKSDSGSDCEWVLLNKPEPPILKPCSSSSSTLTNSDSGVSPRIVNGEPTEPGDFPSLISIYTYYSDYPFNGSYTIPAHWEVRCSGVLVGEEWVLSSRDCFRIARENQNFSRVRFYAGKFNHTPGTEPDVEQGPSEPSEFVDYPKPPSNNPKDTLRLSFTLVKINPPFTLTDRIQPALWPKADAGIPKEPMTIVGWGGLTTKNNMPSGTTAHAFIPHKKIMSVMDQQKCIDFMEEQFEYNITESEFCLENNDDKMSGPRSGDELAYLTDAEGHQTIAALVNFWFHEDDFPPIMSSASYLREWIESVVGPLP